MKAGNRREATGNSVKAKVFGFALGALVSALCASVQAQQGKFPRIGHLSVGAASAPLGEAEKGFWQGLWGIGYIENQYIAVVRRYAEGRAARLSDLAADLVRANVDAIVTLGTPTALAAKRATTEVPVVFYAASDPLGAGIVTSLARPGGDGIRGETAAVADSRD